MNEVWTIKKNKNLSSEFDNLANHVDGKTFDRLEDAEDYIEIQFNGKIDSDCLIGVETKLWYFPANMDENERANDTEGNNVILSVEKLHLNI